MEKNGLNPIMKVDFLNFGSSGSVGPWFNVKENRTEAIKRIDLTHCRPTKTDPTKRERKFEMALKEIVLLEKITELEIPFCTGLYSSQVDGFVFNLHMKYGEGGDLFNFLTHHDLKEATCRRFFRQLLVATKGLFDAHILHNDLKVENIVLVPRKEECTAEDDVPFDVELIDFGLGCWTHDGKDTLMQPCGSPHYVAPEIYCAEITGDAMEKFRAHLYSLGIILFAMLTTSLPYDIPTTKNVVKTHETIRQAEIKLHHYLCNLFRGNKLDKEIRRLLKSKDLGISKAAASLIKGLLRRNPKERITYEEMLIHPWMRKSCKKKLHFGDVVATTHTQVSQPVKQLPPVKHQHSTFANRSLSFPSIHSSISSAHPLTP